MGAERDRVAGFGRLEDGLRQASDWYLWGPYVSERQWGTVREDYSADGGAWDYLPHDAARSRAYRWGEDGLAGFCDVEQRLCLGLALWNGRDPILKERPFGLTGEEANHGEDVKEYWWYLDAIPSHAWNRWRYHYPQAAFPYEDLLAENRRRGKFDMEYELLDTGVFNDDRYWITEVWYAKADPTDVLMTVRITNAGPDADTVHVLPTAWFRNTWSWDADAPKPVLAGAGGSAITVEHPFLGSLELLAGPGPGRHQPGAAVLRERDQPGAPVRGGADDAVPEGRDRRSCDPRRGLRQPRSAGHQVRVLVPADGRARRNRRAAAAAAPGGHRGRQANAGRGPARQRLRQCRQTAPGRGRRVLRRADARRGPSRTRRW